MAGCVLEFLDRKMSDDVCLLIDMFGIVWLCVDVFFNVIVIVVSMIELFGSLEVLGFLIVWLL